MSNDDFVVLSLEEHTELMNELRELYALRAAGVDNWEGYDYAMEMLDSIDV